LNAFQNFQLSSQICMNQLHILTNWMHFKTFIYWGVMFELARITYIYWPIECTSKT